MPRPDVFQAAVGLGQSMTAFLRSWHRQPARVLALALLLAGAATVSGCSTYTLIDALPQSVGGLPEGAKERPATPQEYPAVHDMPPPRSDTPLNEAEKKRLREDLMKVREETERYATGAPQPAAAKGSSKSAGSATRNP
jgi:hypothetical protein